MAAQPKKGKEDGGFMVKVATFIVDRRNLFFLLFGIALIFSVVSMNWVQVENAMSAYLPKTTETRQGLDRMEEQFITYGTAKVMVMNISYGEAEKISEKIEGLEDVIMLTFDNTEEHYNNFSALYDITFGYEETDDRALEALDEVETMLAGYDIYVSTSMGDASAEQIASEMQVISVLVAIVVVSVLLLTSETWAEVPVLLLTFCAAALITKGTNFFMGTISFVSNSVTIVLQLASHQGGKYHGFKQSHTGDIFQFADYGRRADCHDVYAVRHRQRYGALPDPGNCAESPGGFPFDAGIDYAFWQCDG